jgi:MoaA/NifB/PqqE/SkfB family radical SAM enzyme
MDSHDYIKQMNDSLKHFFSEALRVSYRNPAMALFLAGTIIRQKKAAKLRLTWERRGIHVPPYLIASITKSCNLRCKGCYAQVHQQKADSELPTGRWREIFNEASQLGISVIMIAGGEPFTRPEFLELTKAFPEIVFPVFTNGLLLDHKLINILRHQKNVAPIVSIEGFEKETDERRGFGTYDTIQKVIKQLKKSGLFFGVSITVTQENFATVTNEAFIQPLLSAGCRVFIFVEYTPIEAGTGNLILTDTQRVRLTKLMQEFQAKFRGLFVSFPGDEEIYGGCLAAGRGFVHISPDGSFEPCPFAPYSDTSVKNTPLKEALQSELLMQIRQNHNNLKETQGGCALWTNREWVQSLLAEEGNCKTC